MVDTDALLLQADRELMVRRSLPSCSPRAVAAARILSAQDAAELAGRSAESLGQWKQAVSPINEVKKPVCFSHNTSVISITRQPQGMLAA